MRFLLNVANSETGGALHVATGLTREALGDPQHEWFVASSAKAYEQIQAICGDVSDRVKVVCASPGPNRSGRDHLRRIVAEVQPDAVHTPYGPAYVRFPVPHMLGVMLPWVTNPTWQVYRTLKFPIECASWYAMMIYKAYWFKQADAWWTETDVACDGMIHRLKLPADRILVIPNTCSDHYRTDEIMDCDPKPGERLRMLYFAAPYPHKNFPFLAPVAAELQRQRPSLDFEFVITLDPEHPTAKDLMSRAERLGVRHRINNQGPVPVMDGPALYRTCHLCFMPSLLEVFSATFAESMALGCPIVASDLPFSHTVCHDAATYFDPSSAVDAARKILHVLDDPAQRHKQVARGRELYHQFPTMRDKHRVVVDALVALTQGRAITGSVPAGVA